MSETNLVEPKNQKILVEPKNPSEILVDTNKTPTNKTAKIYEECF